MSNSCDDPQWQLTHFFYCCSSIPSCSHSYIILDSLFHPTHPKISHPPTWHHAHLSTYLRNAGRWEIHVMVGVVSVHTWSWSWNLAPVILMVSPAAVLGLASVERGVGYTSLGSWLHCSSTSINWDARGEIPILLLSQQRHFSFSQILWNDWLQKAQRSTLDFNGLVIHYAWIHTDPETDAQWAAKTQISTMNQIYMSRRTLGFPQTLKGPISLMFTGHTGSEFDHGL